MVSEDPGDSTDPSPRHSRRSYLGLVGGVITAGSVVSQPAMATPTPVDLGEQGLSDGDVIDPYLDEAFVGGARVEIPAGSYEWEGGGFEGASENAAVVGQGDVTLELTSDSFRNNVRAESGTVELRNLTVRGKPSEKSHFRLETNEAATIIVDSLNFPDGAENETKCRPFYVPRDHAGTVDIRNSYFSSFSDNGIYASSPGYEDGAGGRVLIENCVAHNINIAAIRVGSSDSVVRNCLIVNDDKTRLGVRIDRCRRRCGRRLGGFRYRNRRCGRSELSRELRVGLCGRRVPAASHRYRQTPRPDPVGRYRSKR